jgi:hypothetical protein
MLLRYLSLGPITSPLFYLQQRYSRSLYKNPEDTDIDLSSTFPRLRLACHLSAARRATSSIMRDLTDFVQVGVDLFVPMSFEELRSRCRPCAGGSWDILCVFGVNPQVTAPPRRNHYRRVGSIKELIVAEGAGILPPSIRATEGRPWNIARAAVVQDSSSSFSLVLRDRTPTPLTASTIDFVLEFLECGNEGVIDEFGEEPWLDLECYPAVFASFISSVSSRSAFADEN